MVMDCAGENHDLMLGGVMQRPVAAVEALFEHEMGKPMLSAAVTMEMPDYIGATQVGPLFNKLQLIFSVGK